MMARNLKWMSQKLDDTRILLLIIALSTITGLAMIVIMLLGLKGLGHKQTRLVGSRQTPNDPSKGRSPKVCFTDTS